MADQYIKDEPGLSQPPKNDSASAGEGDMPAAKKISLNFQSARSLADLASQESASSASKYRPKFLWQSDLSGKPRVQMVKILEDAAEHGNVFLQATTECLKAAREHVPSVKHRIERHLQIYEERRQCQMHIGFLGGSGSGKSSVINALLGEENLLPVSDEAASTAVIVEISYNNSDDPEKRYKASIEGVSESEIRKELDELYEDKAKWDSDAREGEEVDIEILQRMQDTVSKYKCVFPDLKTLDDWTKTTVDQLLTRPCPQYLMDKKRILEMGNREEFARQIKPFIDTSKQRDGAVRVSYWPFVKVVKLFIGANILTAGIVFVDLPGVHDTSAARNAISRKHMKNLDISCVLASSVRAATDQVAKETLDSVTKRNMQFDGLYHADSLFYVISKIDDSLDVDRYINNHSGLKVKLEKDLDHLREREARLKDIESELKTLDNLRAKGSKNLAKLDARIQEDTRMTRKAPVGQKRKLGADDEPTPMTPTLSQVRNARSLVKKDQDEVFAKLWTAQNKKETIDKDLANTRCRIRAECIKARNQIQTAQFIEHYESGRRELGDEEVTKPLKVFCVSAQAFMHLKSGKEAEALKSGFFTKSDTGIPEFRDALISTTWESRQRNARTFSEEVLNAAKLLDIWSADTIADYKMLAHERAIVETKLDEMYEALEKDFEKLNLETRNAVEKLFEDELYPHFEEIAREAHSKQKLEVIPKRIQKKDGIMGRVQKMGWNTYRAINKKLGVWAPRHVEKPIDWNEDMNNLFLERLKPLWEDAVHKKLPALKKPYEDRVEILIAEFADLALGAADDISSSIRDAFENIKDSVLGHRRRLKQGGDDIFHDIDDASKEIWRLVKLECEETWREVYEECGNEKGPGMFARSQKAHRSFIDGDGGLAMYNNASAKMQVAFEKTFEEIPGKLKEKFTESLDAIKQEFMDVLEHHTASGTRNSGRRVNSKLKVNLRNALEPHFTQLYKAWEAEPEVMKQKEPAPVLDEPADGELSDDLEDLLMLGTQEPMGMDDELSDIEDGNSF
ncbi:hypothetical protein NHQ30_009521 [Ciborinia camelliae]|nr:hypothetical protein NHQ30_009521 [Ciborinia camelliae]